MEKWLQKNNHLYPVSIPEIMIEFWQKVFLRALIPSYQCSDDFGLKLIKNI